MLFFLFLVAAMGGALNAVAGGGSFLTLPALLYAGIAPVPANATSTFAMWPASVASAVAYRRELQVRGEWAVPLALTSLLGGLLGGLLLIRTSNDAFMRLLPWLMLVAAATFTFSGRLTARLSRAAFDPADHGRATRRRGMLAWALLLQLAIATYGGYYGGGMGIMILAAMAIVGMDNIHEMNALKVLLAVAINGVALATFVANGAIAWRPGIVMVAGGVLGGYAGAGIARRISPYAVRVFVIIVAWILTLYFFLRPS